MKFRRQHIFFGIDWILVLFYFIFIFLGWLNIYSATYSENQFEIIGVSSEAGKQLIWIGLSIPIILIILMFEAKFYEKYASLIYLISVGSLIGLFFIGKNINGATSWYNLGNFSIQPSEFTKAAVALAIAKLVCDKHFNLKKLKPQLQSFLILTLPIILITLQPDPGSALVYGSFLIVLYREGLPSYYISLGFLAIFLFIVTLLYGLKLPLIGIFIAFLLILLYLFAYRRKAFKKGWLTIIGIFIISSLYVFSVELVYNHVFEQRHRDRFDILLGKKTDTKNIGYNTNQSVTTIASGGFLGKGYLEGERTQGNFVPAQQTDYIFTTVGEEWGFLGSIFVILLFTLFLVRLIFIAERQKSNFSRIYGYSVAALFFTHFTINIGMVLGLVPTIGIPLPFFSYGGSALWGFTVLLFVFIKLDSNRYYEW